MDTNRRDFLRKLLWTSGAVSLVLSIPGRASACLYGNWLVRCPNGHLNIITDITCNRTCETCGALSVVNGEAVVMCPNSHANHVISGMREEREKWVMSYKCHICGQECRRNANQRMARESFYIYQDNGASVNHFSPTGWMGDVGDITLVGDWEGKPKSGKTCIKVEYSAKGEKPTCEYSGPCGWAGVYWQEPPLNWGNGRMLVTTSRSLRISDSGLARNTPR